MRHQLDVFGDRFSLTGSPLSAPIHTQHPNWTEELEEQNGGRACIQPPWEG